MSYVIGMDGGGTKTRAVLVDMEGQVVGDVVVGTTNPNTISKKKLNHTFQELVDHFRSVHPKEFQEVRSVFAGISGAGSEQSRTLVQSTIRSYVADHVTVEVQPDPINALYAGTYGKPGIVQIAGTGSITYGINSKQEHGRVGGWGYLLGDEGSGFDIGRQGLIAALKAYDGRGEQTKLLDLFYTYFNSQNPRDLIDHIYNSNAPKSQIAPLSKVVMEAYKDGDQVAHAILMQCAEEIAHSIATLYEKLFSKGVSIDVVLSGGVFSEDDILLPMIESRISQSGNPLSLVIPKLPPVGGSVIGAYLQLHHEVTTEMLNRLMTDLSRI